MAKQLFANNASTIVAEFLSPVSTTIRVASSGGFPNPTNGDWFLATIVGLGVVEIIKVTAVNGNVWTVQRGQEGTPARSWLLGATIECRVTAGTLENLRDTAADSVGQIRRTKDDKLNDWLSIKDFGAVGDGVADDTSAIQKFFDHPAANKVIPSGTYRLTGGVRIKKAECIYSANATFLFTGSGVDAVSIKPDPGGLINGLQIEGHLNIKRETANYSDAHAALYVEAMYSSVINVSVAKFEKGIHLHGNGTRGVVYNKFFIGDLENCKYSQYFSSATGGWVNMNLFIGGRYYGGTAGMACHIEMDTTNYQFNGNKWLYPSLESSVAGHLLFNLKGIYNEIVVGYAEHDGGTLPWAVLDGTYNAVRSNSPYMPNASFNDPSARLNVTGQYCVFDGVANLLRSAQAVPSRFKTGSATEPFAVFENTNTNGVSAIDVMNSSTPGADAFRVLNPDGSPGVALNAAGRRWLVKRNATGTISKSVLWTEATAPTSGTWVRGDIAWATNPTRGGPAGWICITGGTPGTWVPFGQIGVRDSISSAPEFVGQLAVTVAGDGYIAVGTASTSDWKKITP